MPHRHRVARAGAVQAFQAGSAGAFPAHHGATDRAPRTEFHIQRPARSDRISLRSHGAGTGLHLGGAPHRPAVLDFRGHECRDAVHHSLPGWTLPGRHDRRRGRLRGVAGHRAGTGSPHHSRHRTTTGAGAMLSTLRLKPPALQFAPEWAAILAEVLVDIVWAGAIHFHLIVGPHDFLQIGGALAIAAAVMSFSLRRMGLIAEYFALTASATGAFAVLSYLALASSGPLQDEAQQAADRAQGKDRQAGYA